MLYIKLKERKDDNYFLSVEETIGELLNVGAIVMGMRVICEYCPFKNKIEYTGFFKRDIINEITFRINRINEYLAFYI